MYKLWLICYLFNTFTIKSNTNFFSDIEDLSMEDIDIVNLELDELEVMTLDNLHPHDQSEE